MPLVLWRRRWTRRRAKASGGTRVESRGAGSPAALLRSRGTTPRRTVAARPPRGGLCRHPRRIGRRCACIRPAALPSAGPLTSCSNRNRKPLRVLQSVVMSKAAAGSGHRLSPRSRAAFPRARSAFSAGRCASVQAVGLTVWPTRPKDSDIAGGKRAHRPGARGGAPGRPQ